ncbi:MAG: N-6 DNA methylase, partial [Spirochaetota bacterium]|nr:N-6 DNA methylase [Spirochaetota bacterium]
NIDKIVKIYASRENVEYTAKVVPNGDIAEQGYNLSVSTYVAQTDKRETVDITVLNAEIERIVKREDVLRKEINAIVAEIEWAAILTQKDAGGVEDETL